MKINNKKFKIIMINQKILNKKIYRFKIIMNKCNKKKKIFHYNSRLINYKQMKKNNFNKYLCNKNLYRKSKGKSKF